MEESKKALSIEPSTDEISDEITDKATGKIEKKPHNRIKRYLTELGVYAAVFLLTTVLFLWGKPLFKTISEGMAAQSFMLLSLISIIIVAICMGTSKKLTTRRILILMLLAGLALRIGYMLYTPASARQHDVYTDQHTGHEGYAWILFTTKKLPTTNAWQFYHPPMNALMQAGFMRFMRALTGAFDEIFTWFGRDGYFPTAFLHNKPKAITDGTRYYLYQTCQILSVMYACITCVALIKTLWLFDFSDKTKLIMSAVVIFFPRHIAFSGLLNNDPIAYMFSMLAFYHAVKWWKGGKSIGRILACALFLGLGMMSKLSSATIALPIAGIFIYEFVHTLRKKTDALSIGKMLLQYGAFLAICAPLGLWFQVYANARFGQAFGYVPSNLTHRLYTGDETLFERFIFPFDMSEFFGSIYCRPFDGNYWLFNFSLRSALFTESSYPAGEGFAVASIVAAYAAVGALFTAIVYSCVRYFKSKKQGKDLIKMAKINPADLLLVVLLVQSQALSEIYFYLSAPFACTMDFRYIMPIILGIALLIGYTNRILTADGGKASLILNKTVTVATFTLLITISMFYCTCV